MAQYNPPDLPPGTVPTGANLDSWLTDIETESTSLQAEQLDPEARFDAAMFNENASVEHVNVVGFMDDPDAADIDNGRARTELRYAKGHGKLDAKNAFNHATGLATTLTVLLNDGELLVGGTIEPDDKIEITAAAQVSGCVRLLWRLVGEA